MNLSIRKMFFAISTVFAIFAILILAKSILIPLAFALLFAIILFLPFTAMFKVVCEQFEELKPFALLIGEREYVEKENYNQFNSKWNQKLKSKVLALFQKMKI